MITVYIELTSDIWRNIQRWSKLFRQSTNRKMEIVHVDAHCGIQGNERSDRMTAQGSKLRYRLMVEPHKDGWLRHIIEQYWSSRV